jgi:hypothetical protein
MTTSDVDQRAPHPTALSELVASVRYKPGWSFRLAYEERGQGCAGLTLTITVETTNSYPPHEPIGVRHLFIVPAAAYNTRSWRRWLFERVVDVERHEAMEFFVLGDNVHPYAPHHGPGEDPYTTYEHADAGDTRISSTGRVNINVHNPRRETNT